MARLIIDFKADFETDSRVALMLEGVVPEHEHIWLWDHFSSLVLHQLQEDGLAEHLLETLGQWAGAFAPKMLSPVNELHAEGAMIIDKSLQIRPVAGEVHECYVLEVTPQSDNWPEVNVKLPQQPTETRMSYAVIALAQYFLNNNPLFFRELPLHILALRKFYQEQMSYRDQASVAEAPGYAFQMAMRFFEDMNNASS